MYEHKPKRKCWKLLIFVGYGWYFLHISFFSYSYFWALRHSRAKIKKKKIIQKPIYPLRHCYKRSNKLLFLCYILSCVNLLETSSDIKYFLHTYKKQKQKWTPLCYSTWNPNFYKKIFAKGRLWCPLELIQLRSPWTVRWFASCPGSE